MTSFGTIPALGMTDCHEYNNTIKFRLLKKDDYCSADAEKFEHGGNYFCEKRTECFCTNGKQVSSHVLLF